METVIVDTSVAIKWLLAEDHATEAIALLDPMVALHAPDILLLEADNVLCRRTRKGEFDPARLEDLRRTLRAIGVTYHGFRDLLDAAVAISVTARQAVYDCLFIALAETIDGRAVTSDLELVERVRGTRWERRVMWIGDRSR